MCIKTIKSWLASALFVLFASGAPGFVSEGGNIAIAQTQYITGTVVDDFGEPIIGANIRVKGTTKGTITDLNGKFSLDVAPGQTIEVSFVGFSTQTVVAASDMRIILQEDAQSLDDVVVVGYGVQKKETYHRCHGAGEGRRHSETLHHLGIDCHAKPVSRCHHYAE